MMSQVQILPPRPEHNRVAVFCSPFYTWSCGGFNERLPVSLFDPFTGLTIHFACCKILQERLKNGTGRKRERRSNVADDYERFPPVSNKHARHNAVR
jgi:hypothetical protein